MTDDNRDRRGTDDRPNPKVVRERIAMAADEARELVDARTQDIHRCIAQGLAWNHPTVITHRARLVAALADLDVLTRLTRPIARPAGTGDDGIPPLTTRRGR